MAHTSIRFGIGRFTTDEEVDYAVQVRHKRKRRKSRVPLQRWHVSEWLAARLLSRWQVCVKHVERLREMSPLWEMVQEGIDLKTIQWSGH